MAKLKKLLTPRVTMGLFLLALLLLLLSSVSGTRAALTYFSDDYTAEVDMLMRGASYQDVIAYMEEHDKGTPDNPFGQQGGSPAQPAQPAQPFGAPNPFAAGTPAQSGNGGGMSQENGGTMPANTPEHSDMVPTQSSENPIHHENQNASSSNERDDQE